MRADNFLFFYCNQGTTTDNLSTKIRELSQDADKRNELLSKMRASMKEQGMIMSGKFCLHGFCIVWKSSAFKYTKPQQNCQSIDWQSRSQKVMNTLLSSQGGVIIRVDHVDHQVTADYSMVIGKLSGNVDDMKKLRNILWNRYSSPLKAVQCGLQIDVYTQSKKHRPYIRIIPNTEMNIARSGTMADMPVLPQRRSIENANTTLNAVAVDAVTSASLAQYNNQLLWDYSLTAHYCDVVMQSYVSRNQLRSCCQAVPNTRTSNAHNATIPGPELEQPVRENVADNRPFRNWLL